MAELLLNSKLWDHLTKEEKNKILTTLRTAGAIRPEDTISSSKDAVIPDSRARLENINKGVQTTVCQVACGTAAGAGFAACALLAPELVEPCLTAATVAYDACMGYCDE